MNETSPNRRPLGVNVLIWLALVGSYLVAAQWPGWVGWENGPVENMQAVMLAVGGLLALDRRRRCSLAGRPQQAAFWLVVAPIWFALAARELSWGAVFLPPLDFSAEMGPAFSSSRQLAYKGLVAPVLAFLLLGMAWSFVRTRQHQTLARLWRAGGFPLLEIGTFVLCMLASTAAEGHMGLGIRGLGHAQAQTFEELAELWAYAALLLAQQRVWRVLR